MVNPPAYVLDKLVVSATRIQGGGFMGFTGYHTTFTLTWNPTTGGFDTSSSDFATFTADDPNPAAPPPPAVQPVPPVFVMTVAADGPLFVAVQRIMQTFIYTMSDGSQQTLNLFIVSNNGQAVYYWSTGTNWYSAPFPAGPWAPASAPPKNAQYYTPI